jgi:6-phosphofructokinase 1
MQFVLFMWSIMHQALVRAGPRPLLHFKPDKVVAAIVTCGGICPGLNSVIHYLTETLLKNYSAARVLGVRGGFSGFHDPVVRLNCSVLSFLY